MKKFNLLMTLAAGALLASCGLSSIGGLTREETTSSISTEVSESVSEEHSSEGSRTTLGDEKVIEIVSSIAYNLFGTSVEEEDYWYDAEYDTYVTGAMSEEDTAADLAAIALDYIPEGGSVVFDVEFDSECGLYYGAVVYEAEEVAVEINAYEADSVAYLEYDVYYAGGEENPDDSGDIDVSTSIDSESKTFGNADCIATVKAIANDVFGTSVEDEDWWFEDYYDSYCTGAIFESATPKDAADFGVNCLPSGYVTCDQMAYDSEYGWYYGAYGYESTGVMVEIYAYEDEKNVSDAVLEILVYYAPEGIAGGETSGGYDFPTTTNQDGSKTAIIAFADFFENQEVLGDISNGVVGVEFDQATGQTAPAYYASGTAARLYGNTKVCAYTCDGAQIVSVVFNFGSASAEKLGNVSCSGATWSVNNLTGTATNIADDVTLTYNASSGHVRIVSIEITYTVVA